MAFEFDNEIDFLLRKTPRQNFLIAANAAENAIHLDADDLIAFAENALPQPARQNFILHLADCNSCRETLSNLVLLNEATDEETIGTAEPEKTVVGARSSWLDSLKKLFAIPALGYAAAALAISFVGVFAFVVLRPIQNSETAQIVQTEAEPVETPARKRSSAPAVEPKDAESEAKPEETPAETPNPNIDIPAQETPAPTTETAENLPPSVRITRGESPGNRNAALPETVVARNNSAISANSSADVAAPIQAQPETNITSSSSGAGAVRPGAPSVTGNNLPAAPKPPDNAKEEFLARSNQGQTPTKENERESDDAAPPARESRATTNDPRKSVRKQKLLETRTVNGRAFQKIGGVWTDTAYNTQNVINVSRGADDHKRLDSGLRAIAEKLSGEIIVVWQGRAYRIR